MKSPSLLLIILFVILAGSNCKKSNNPKPDNPYGLPNATQTGANTFACLINGQPFIAFYDGVNTKAHLNVDTMGIAGSPKLMNYFAFIVFTISIGTSGNLDFSFGDPGVYGKYGSDSSCSGISSTVITSFPDAGTIHLTKLDSLNKIVSGTFQCSFPIPGCDTLKVTQGRFDFRYYE